VIVSVGGESVKSIEDLENGVSEAQERGRDAVLFRVQREDNTSFVGVPLERG
jgi:hypothetical protein